MPTIERLTGYRATAKLKKHRMRLGKSQAEFGEETGLGQAGVSRLESGDRVMRYDTADRVCDALGLTLAEAIAQRLLRTVGGG